MTLQLAKLPAVLIGILILLCGVLGCNSTPTVPVPPPEVISVSAPQDGYVTVMLNAGEAEQGDIVLVFNEMDGAGVMERIDNPDGSFEVEVEAVASDRLYIQIKQDNELSKEEEHIVPNP